MTEKTVKIYETEPYTGKFIAKITEVQGDSIALDRTAFYPGGGGQDADVGTLNGLPVTDVRGKDGIIHHKVPGHRFVVGEEVSGEVAWDRRMDLMRAHTGEHLLFSALNRLVPELELVKIAITPEKKSFIVKGNIDWTIMMDAEKMVNEVIWQHLRTESIMVSKGDRIIEQARIKLDRIPGDKVRLVRIGEFDLAACAGVHVQETGDIGMLLVEKLTSAKPSGDLEIEFSVGRKALARSLFLSTLAVQASEEMGSHPEDMISAMRNQAEELKKAQGSLRQLAKDALSSLAPTKVGETDLFCEVTKGVDRKTLSDEATKKVQDKNAVCIFVDEGDKMTVVVAASKEGVHDASVILQAILQPLGGKGGGNRQFATGGANVEGGGNEALQRGVSKVKPL